MISFNYKIIIRMKNTLDNMPTSMMCPCGGGQSCIVDRRFVGDYVHEDDVFTNIGLPLRKNCYNKFYKCQAKALKNFM